MKPMSSTTFVTVSPSNQHSVNKTNDAATELGILVWCVPLESCFSSLEISAYRQDFAFGCGQVGWLIRCSLQIYGLSEILSILHTTLFWTSFEKKQNTT